MRKKTWKLAAAAVGLAAAMGIGGLLWYVNDVYPGVGTAHFLESSETVTVQKVEEGWFFDGAGTQGALIFYPGAKVETEAYAPLLHRIAEGGLDCFLVEMPCHLAFLGRDKADAILQKYEYENWYLAGHSLGGAMAASYAETHAEQLDGLILLAAYSVSDLTETGLQVLSVYGSEDAVVNRGKIEEGRTLVPETYVEQVIEGGNHAQFGSYGEQKGDGRAAIDAETQQEETARLILTYFG